MSPKLVSMRQACNILGISLSTLRRRIESGEIESKLEGRRRFVLIPYDTSSDTSKAQELTQPSLIEQLRSEVQRSTEQLDKKDKQIEKLQQQLEKTNEALAEASHRHDTVVMQMTRLLEYHQQPFWRKLFGRKALPPPTEETIMDARTGGEKGTDGK